MGNIIKKVKLKLRTKTGQEGSFPFFNLGARFGWLINATPRPLYLRKKRSRWAPWPVWASAENLAPTGIFVFLFLCTSSVLLLCPNCPDCTTHNTNIHAGFEHATPASDRPQTLALDRSATGIGWYSIPGPSS